jgi:hypothetical protein
MDLKKARAFSDLLWQLNVAGTSIAIVRLYREGLHKTYRWFFGYLIVSLLRTLLLYSFRPSDPVYMKIWLATEPILWVFYVGVVTELYSLFLSKYPGISSWAAKFFYGASAASAMVSALVVFMTPGGVRKGPELYHFELLAERGIVGSLALFLLLLLMMVAFFPVPQSRNLLIHCCLFTGYFFAANVIGMVVQIFELKWLVLFANNARLAVALICQVCWALLLSSRGEERRRARGLGVNLFNEKKLLEQMETLNASLLRSTRK